MGHAKGVPVLPRLHVFAQVQRIDAVAADLRDEVVLDGEVDTAGQEGLERQVHVAHVHHDAPVDGILAGEGEAEAARPMRHRAGGGAEACGPATGRAAQIDGQVGASGGGDAHFGCLAQHLDAEL